MNNIDKCICFQENNKNIQLINLLYKICQDNFISINKKPKIIFNDSKNLNNLEINKDLKIESNDIMNLQKNVENVENIENVEKNYSRLNNIESFL